MRQAGRIFPRYRKLREKFSFMDVCRSPKLTSYVTRMPVKRLGVDAAIIFADIMLPLGSLGRRFELVKGVGPVIDNPVRRPEDVEEITPGNPAEDVNYLYRAIHQTRMDLHNSIPLIGFCGAPFTLACYIIQGRPSRTYHRVKQFYHQYPQTFHRFMEKICEVLETYLKEQVHAGADLVQIFDSWVGILSPSDYNELVKPHLSQLFDSLPNDLKTIYFGTGTASLLKFMAETGPDCLGVDWRIELEEANRRIQTRLPLQGNLDPSLMLGPFEALTDALDQILEQARELPGHIFNLGHGFHPLTRLETARNVTNYIKNHS